jgi:glycosyltransferase involved in cell wall biosynthesis
MDPSRRLRVLTMVDVLSMGGGGERIAREIAAHLDQERFDVSFWTTRTQYSTPDGVAELAARGVEVHQMPREGSLDLLAWRPLISYARRRGIDVLHTHKFGSNAWGATLLPLMGGPAFVAHEHTWAFDGARRRVLVDRELIARRAGAIVAVSEEDRRRMIDLEGIAADKVRFIPNGIPAPPPPSPGRDVRAELAIEPGQPIVGAVATIRPQKALDVLIRAFAKVRETVPDAVLLIVGGGGEGPGGEGERLAGVAAELGLGAAVKFLGARDDVPDLVATFDVAALSSDFEGSPLSVMEYMAAAKPVVATAVGGLDELVKDGSNGFLVEPRDPDALAAALARVLGDPALAKSMGQAGEALRRERFSIEATTAAVGDLYEELCAGRQ